MFLHLFLHYSFPSMFLPHFTFSFQHVPSIFFPTSLFIPPPTALSLHSRHSKQYVPTLNPRCTARRPVPSPCCTRNCKIYKAKFQSWSQQSSLLPISPCLSIYFSLSFLLQLFLVIIIKMWECLWVDPYGNDHNNSAKR